MKSYLRRKVQITTLLLALVFSVSVVCGCVSEPIRYATTMGVTVTDITDQVNSSANEYALTSDAGSSRYGEDDSCWVIVRFNSDSVLDTAMSKNSKDIYSYINSSAALKQAESINKAQDKFVRKYSNVIENTSYRYTALFNGLAAQIRYGDISKLLKDSSVSDVIVCERYYTPQDVTVNDVSVYSTGIYDPGDVGYDGSNTIIAVLDTGLDYTHTAFAEQPTGTLAVDLDRVRGLLSGFAATEMSAQEGIDLTADELYVSDKVPFAYDYADNDANVYPTNDHGTHVAGIIAGHDDVITGIATNAQLAIMKVFGDVDEGASTESILAALNDCVVLQVDAINMSLGSSCGFSRESDNEAINNIYDSIREAGICLICAASNDYASSHQSPNGDMSLVTNPDYGTVGSPSSFEAAMSVASISGVKTKYLMVNGQEEVYFTEAGNTGSVKKDFVGSMLGDRTSATFDYVVVPGLGSESNYYGLDVAGKIAVVKRGSLNFEEKITTATNHGAIGVIVYNNVSGVISMSVGKTKTPSCSVSMEAGKYFEAHTTGTLVMDKSYEAGPFMSEFSSWGPLPNLEFKPDITAHGGEIYSAVRGGYDVYSGTSMACPNMAGATILVRQYVRERFPELSPYEVTELTYQLLMSTATIAYNEEGNPYSPRKQGAGLADIGKSVKASAYLYVDGTNKPKLTLGHDPERTGQYTLVFNIRNLGSTAQSYKVNPIVMTESLSSDNKTVTQKAHMLNDTSYVVSVEGSGAKVYGNNLTLAGYATATITIELTLSDAAKQYLDQTFANGMYVEGYIELLNNSDVDLNIGFLGFYGDWSVAPIMDVTAYEVGEDKDNPSILEDDKLVEDVYATLPMGGFRYLVSATEYEESYYGMGQFAYKIADGYVEPAIREDKASLTVNMEGSYSLKLIAAGMLRNAKTVRMQIANSVTGEVIWEGVDYDVRKSYFSGARRPAAVMVEFNVNEYNLPNNSKYTFSMECDLDWESTANNLKNTFSFDFYIDNEAPVVLQDRTQVRVEGSGVNKRYYLDVYAYDNHYIQGYRLGTYSGVAPDGSLTDELGFHNYIIPLYDSKRNTENRISYDITRYWSEIQQNDGKIYVELFDYAKNTSTFEIKVPSSIADEIKFSSTMRAVNTRVNEVVDLKDYLVTAPNNVWVKDIKWSVEDESVALVRDGVVLGVGQGSTTLHVSNYDGTAEATLPVTVREQRYDLINLTQIQLNKTTNVIERGEEFTLTATLVPHDLFAKDLADKLADVNLTWSTSGGIIKFVIVDSDGNEQLVDRVEGETSVKVRSLRTGSATINVIDSKSPSRVNSSCSIGIKSEYNVDGVYLQNYVGRGDEHGVVEIPDDLGIVYIYPYAFMNNPYITKIIVPDGVTEIMEAAIYGCDNLEEIVLPDSCKILDKWSIAWNPSLKKIDLGGVNTIGEMAFIGDGMLTDIDFSKVYSVGPRAFMNCVMLGELDISSIKSMGAYAFEYCSGITNIITGPHTPIGDYAFMYCMGLTNVELNGGVIGEGAFEYCYNLQSVTINNVVDTIDNEAFYGCTSLSEINYRSTVRIIGINAFRGCAFTSIVIPDGVEEIGAAAYGDNEKATEVVISSGAKLSAVGESIFFRCNNLTSFVVEEGNAYLSADGDGLLYDKAQHKLLLVPYGYADTEVTLPESVTQIGKNAFSWSNVQSVKGENVTRIEDFAFFESKIADVEFGEVSYIGEASFYNAVKFTSWPDCFNNVRHIGDFAFTVDSSYSSGGLSGVVPELSKLTYLGGRAFVYTEITKITLGSQLKEIGDYTFYGCGRLNSVTFGSGLERIGAFAFANCSAITELVIPNTVTSLGEGAFLGCTRLSSVTLPGDITEIPAQLFANCPALVSLKLPSKVTSIGDLAFARYSVDARGLISFSTASITDIDLSNIQHIGNYAFTMSRLQRLDAPDVVTVGAYAFWYNTALTEVSLPEARTIGDAAFARCSRLTSVEIPKATTLGVEAFSDCIALSELDLTNVTTLGDFVFAGAYTLQKVQFGKLKYIGKHAFVYTAITELNLPSTLEQLAEQALSNYETVEDGVLTTYATSLQKITVDQGNPLYFTDDQGVLYKRLSNGLVTLVYYPVNNVDANNNARTEYVALEMTVKVEAYAFSGNRNLRTITLPERLQVLGAGAFYGCTSLATLNLRSAAAPVLEMIYNEERGGIENHYYNTFQSSPSLTSTTSRITINYPQNGTGYDAYNWQLYLKDNLFATGAIARTQTTIDMSDTLTAMDISALTLDDLSQVVLLRRIYASLANEQKSFLNSVIDKLSAAEQQLASLISARIATLPAKVTEADRPLVEELRALYDQCNSQIQSYVTNVDKLTKAEEALANEGGNGGGGNNGWMLPTFVSIGAALVVGAAVAVTLILLKRKKAQQDNSQVTEEDANETAE